jgi:predicted nucleic acid-binding protein
MNSVFADAFYFVARLNSRDQHHTRVIEYSKRSRVILITTDWVLMEVADALAKSESRGRTHAFIQRLRESPECEIVPATRELFDQALELYRQHSDKDWTLTDCTSFVVMQRRNIVDALTGDRHFEQAGFQAIFK